MGALSKRYLVLALTALLFSALAVIVTTAGTAQGDQTQTQTGVTSTTTSPPSYATNAFAATAAASNVSVHYTRRTLAKTNHVWNYSTSPDRSDNLFGAKIQVLYKRETAYTPNAVRTCWTKSTAVPSDYAINADLIPNLLHELAQVALFAYSDPPSSTPVAWSQSGDVISWTVANLPVSAKITLNADGTVKSFVSTWMGKTYDDAAFTYPKQISYPKTPKALCAAGTDSPPVPSYIKRIVHLTSDHNHIVAKLRWDIGSRAQSLERLVFAAKPYRYAKFFSQHWQTIEVHGKLYRRVTGSQPACYERSALTASQIQNKLEVASRGIWSLGPAPDPRELSYTRTRSGIDWRLSDTKNVHGSVALGRAGGLHGIVVKYGKTFVATREQVSHPARLTFPSVPKQICH